jgi:predicted dehydrogenase
MKVAMIGAGLQGKRIAPAVKEHKGSELVLVTAKKLDEAERLASQLGCKAGEGWEAAIASDADAIVVCTPPDLHAEITIAAARAKKHVLCEKPLARTVAEGEAMVKAAADAGITLMCAFNHRFHPAIWEAKKRVDAGFIGKPLSARCRYGIGGRPGYEKEWRADPKVTAGGQLMEQGIHGIDLFRWFLGDVKEVMGMVATQYWPLGALEDNGHAVLRHERGAIAMIHSSLTQWKNIFSFEVGGEDGYLEVDGLGASYGTERLISGKRDFVKPFTDEIIEYRGGDKSWGGEYAEFVSAIAEKRKPVGTGEDGLEAMRVVHAIYESSKTGRAVTGRA